MIKIQFVPIRLGLAMAVSMLIASGDASDAALDAKVEVIDPYQTWLEGETWGVYIRITNTGDEAFPLLFHPDLEASQIFVTAEFEAGSAEDPQPRTPPLPKVEEADWGNVRAAAERVGFTLHPGQAFVYGPEAFVTTEGMYGLGASRMSWYRVDLVLGDGHWVSSERVKRDFIHDDSAWTSAPLTNIGLTGADVSAPVRVVNIAGANWLFEGRQRLCIVPGGATPRISTFDNREYVRIEFEGSDEEPVVTSNRHGHPLSGSERTVPHLYLWKSLTSRPMGAATPDTRPEKATAVPAEGERSGTSPRANASASAGRGHSTGSPTLWVTLGVGAVILAGAAWRWRHRAG